MVATHEARGPPLTVVDEWSTAVATDVVEAPQLAAAIDDHDERVAGDHPRDARAGIRELLGPGEHEPLASEDGRALAFVDLGVAIHRRRERHRSIGAGHDLILEFAVMTEIRERVAMEDGVRLAISRFEPDGAGPWPVIIEALPYRKDDLTASYRSEYRRFADEGRYVVVRVDVRGTGSSEGIATDEYPVQEQRDLVRLIAWCASQPWSTGKVGMYGTSYSGFNSLQVAIERPPELGAICAIYATDDRYTDDVHYAGGVLRAIDLVDYVHYMVAMNALPTGAGRVRRRVARRMASTGRRDRAVDAPLARGTDRR